MAGEGESLAETPGGGRPDNCPRDGGPPAGIKSRREAERCVPGGGLSTAAAEQLTAEVLLGGYWGVDKQIKANTLADRHYQSLLDVTALRLADALRKP